MRILLVEDSAAQRLVLLRQLQSCGHAVTAVADAEGALESPGPFDIVLTDLSLPGLCGQALITSLRARHGQQLRIVAMSASHAAVAGADALLAKPVSQAALALALEGQTMPTPALFGQRLDQARLAVLQRDIGRDCVMGMIRRFIAETDTVCAAPSADHMAMHHIAGAAALFGAMAMHAAALAGRAEAEWPLTRAALLATLG